MASKGKILIVDDEKDIRFLLREILEDEGYSVAEAPHSEAAYAEIAAHGMPDLVILDIWLENSDRDGMEILSDLKKRSKTLPVLMISGHGNIEMAVKAIKLGAYDFIEKPFNTDRLIHLVTRAFDAGRKRYGVPEKISISAISTEMQAVLKQAQKAAQGDARVLVLGHWGAGRTHLARFIHQESQRAARPCLCLPAANLDAAMLQEALGQEGSVVLRDVQEMPVAMQSDLLARLNAKPEARVMATARPDIEAMRKSGAFLPDLYERLAVTTISVPDLADRRADIADLAQSMILTAYESMGGTQAIRLGEAAVTALKMGSYEGHLAALQAKCRMAAVMLMLDGGAEVTAAMLSVPEQGQGHADHESALWAESDLRTAREHFERWYFEKLMARFDGNVSQVAAFAGMDRTALHRKLKALKEGPDGAEEAAA